MSSPPRPPIKHCPLCGVAMLGSKSSETAPQLDIFSCLKCETVVTFTEPPRKPRPDR